MTAAVHVGPEPVPALVDAVRRAGGQVVPLERAEAIVYYGSDDPGELRSMIHDRIRWVQLPHASYAVMKRYAPISLPLHAKGAPGFAPPVKSQRRVPGGTV